LSNIPSAGPSITQAEIDLVTEAVTYGWYESRNMHFAQFNEEFSQLVQKKYILPVNNCTSAIHLALLSAGIGPGDEVIVPDVTWVASAAPIIYTGATPVFCDIDRYNWCIDPQSFENCITNKTKAVVMVDLYGNLPDVDKILSIARANDILVIEDAAEGLGATYNGKPAGSFGDISVFSFNATKIAVAGQGGVFATDDEKLFERAKRLYHHGMDKYTDKTTFWSLEVGYNYQWTNIQAALALAQIRRLDELVKQRRDLFKWYKQRLEGIDGIQLNAEAEGVTNTYWVVSAIVDPSYSLRKEDFIKRFKDHNIDTRPFFYPVSSMPAYENYKKSKDMATINPVSYELSSYGISFPSAAIITEDQVDRVCTVFKNILENN
jgi:perosamine synthetase